MKAKLFEKYGRINILVMIVIFLIASVAYYFAINFVQLEQVDDDLRIEEEEIVLYVGKYDELPKTFSVDDQLIEFRKSGEPLRKRYFSRTDLKNEKGQLEDFRQLIFGVLAGGQWYTATVSKSLRDTDDLIKSMLWITSSTILLILLATLVINRFVLKKLWKPFYDTLSILNGFKIEATQKLDFPRTTTEEFELMINSLELTTQQAQLEYLSLKTFSENASHEIQTPIAIIQSKLDLLIQDEELTEKQSSTLQTIYGAIQRLTRLNTSLLLMAKIENRQFANVQRIDFKAKMEEKIVDFQELWQSQQITVNCSLKESSFSMNIELADILINNLLSNATKHNYSRGNINIVLQEEELVVTNTSKEPSLDQGRLFHRFYKPSLHRDDNGLGLSIIKQICDSSALITNYLFNDGKHRFSIRWKAGS